MIEIVKSSKIGLEVGGNEQDTEKPTETLYMRERISKNQLPEKDWGNSLKVVVGNDEETNKEKQKAQNVSRNQRKNKAAWSQN